MIYDLNLKKIRQSLIEELDKLLAQMDDGQDNRGRRAGTNPDRDDLAHNYVFQERRLAMRDVESAQVAQINEALERIAKGTYGTCANCGEVIPSERLDIIPYATMCVRCQQEKDKQ